MTVEGADHSGAVRGSVGRGSAGDVGAGVESGEASVWEQSPATAAIIVLGYN